ncbi:MAG: XRE family transcriptional regulator, partial [Chloroflexota bacterium]|nr:XRE family transcriptional regulator [Chloroflexota bacterium]
MMAGSAGARAPEPISLTPFPVGALAPARPPVPLNDMIGRDQELAACTALLRDPTVRFVTLTGPGGSGKTRLALEAARVLGAERADG